jgi:hypothetical protein
MKFVMSDARAFTDYSANCSLNAILQQKYGTTDIHAFRYYLQQNAEQVMKDLQPADESKCKTCPVCQTALSYRPTGTVQPQKQ